MSARIDALGARWVKAGYLWVTDRRLRKEIVLNAAFASRPAGRLSQRQAHAGIRSTALPCRAEVLVPVIHRSAGEGC